MIDFLIFYEHVNREIENDTLLKHELEKRGYSCEIIRHSGPGLYHYHKKKNRARVVVTPWLRYNVDVIEYLQYAKKPYKLVNLQYEQVYNKTGLDSGLVQIIDEAKKCYHTCWGENSYKRLLDSGVPKENLYITGAMQQDYGRPLFNDYYYPREKLAEEFSLDKDKKWILFVSSFTATAYGKKGAEILERKYKGIKESRAFSIKSHMKMLDWIEEFLKNSDSEFIYRPHPSEKDCERLVEMEEKYPNFHINRAYSVKQWAKVSDRVNLWISTSNAEICSLGVDYSIIRPYPIPEHIEVESMHNEEFIDTLEDLTEINTNIPTPSKERVKKRLENLSYFYDYDEDRAAYERFADFLEVVYKKQEGIKFNLNLFEKIKYTFREFKNRTASKFAEKQIENPKNNCANNPFIKPVVKTNICKLIDNFNTKCAAEQRVTEYLNNHE